MTTLRELVANDFSDTDPINYEPTRSPVTDDAPARLQQQEHNIHIISEQRWLQALGT